MEINKVYFTNIKDDRGNLVAIEGMRDVPFEIKRVYYISNVQFGVCRGKHAHKSLKQVLICVSGSCKILLDNGIEKEHILLDRPDEGVFISNNMWREMYEFSDNAVLLVLASEVYNENDYIRDYMEFKRYIEGELKYNDRVC